MDRQEIYVGVQKVPDGEHIGGIHFTAMKCGASCRKIDFELNVKYLDALFKEQGGVCALSGIKLVETIGMNASQRRASNMSLDRIDSKKGYVEGNVQLDRKSVV